MAYQIIPDVLRTQDKCGGILHTGNAAVHILLQTVPTDEQWPQEPSVEDVEQL